MTALKLIAAYRQTPDLALRLVMMIYEATLIIPASGVSKRFGPGNKLMANLCEKPVAQYVIDTAAEFNFAQKIAVVPRTEAALWDLFHAASFECIDNPEPKRGMGHSLSLGAQHCTSPHAVVMLADMPLVPSAHIAALLQGLGSDAAVFTKAGGIIQPPAALGAQALKALRRGGGDAGLRAWRAGGKTVNLAQELSQDIDTQEDLDALQTLHVRRAHGAVDRI